MCVLVCLACLCARASHGGSAWVYLCVMHRPVRSYATHVHVRMRHEFLDASGRVGCDPWLPSAKDGCETQTQRPYSAPLCTVPGRPTCSRVSSLLCSCFCTRPSSHEQFTQLYPHNKHGGVDLAAIAKEAGACKHFCPSKWAKVGGMLQVSLSSASSCHPQCERVWELYGTNQFVVETAQASSSPRLPLSFCASCTPSCLLHLFSCTQMDGSVKYGHSDGSGLDTSHYSF